MVAYVCNGSTWEVRQENSYEFEASLGYTESYIKAKQMDIKKGRNKLSCEG